MGQIFVVVFLMTLKLQTNVALVRIKKFMAINKHFYSVATLF